MRTPTTTDNAAPPTYGWESSPDFDPSDEASLQEAVDRANGGPVYISPDPPASYLDRLAIARVRTLLADDIHNTHAVAQHTSLRQAAGETPIEFVRRIVGSYLDEAMN